MDSVLQNTRRHDIAFHRDGRIDITASVSKALGLACGDVIDIAYDKTGCYLYVKFHRAYGRHEAMVYRPCRRGTSLRCSSVRLYQYFARLCNTDVPVFRFCVGDAVTINDVIDLPIITKLKL